MMDVLDKANRDQGLVMEQKPLLRSPLGQGVGILLDFRNRLGWVNGTSLSLKGSMTSAPVSLCPSHATDQLMLDL